MVVQYFASHIRQKNLIRRNPSPHALRQLLSVRVFSKAGDRIYPNKFGPLPNDDLDFVRLGQQGSKRRFNLSRLLMLKIEDVELLGGRILERRGDPYRAHQSKRNPKQ